MTDPILLAGATGTQGGAVARAAVPRPPCPGHHPRPRQTSRPAACRARRRGGDSRLRGRRSAAHGGHRHLGPVRDGHAVRSGPAGGDRQAINLLDAAARAGTGHLVYSSVASALDGTGIPHFESKAEVERHLATLAVPWTVLAPAAFLENLHAPWSAPALAQGVYSFLLPSDVPLQQVAVADLADLAALVLTDRGRFAGRRIELASVEQTGDHLAGALSRQFEHAVRYEESRPVDDDDLAKMAEFLRRTGYAVDIPALRAEYPQVGWHGLEDWIAEQDWSAARAA